MLFRCLRSGNTVNIDQKDDIERMMNFEGYECVERIEPSIQSVTHSVGEDHGLQETQNAVEEAGVPEEEVIAVIAVQDAEPVAPVKRRGRPAKVEVVGEL